MEHNVEDSFGEFEHLELIEDLLDTQVTDKWPELLEVDRVDQEVDQLSQHVRLVAEDNEEEFVESVLKLRFGTAEVVPGGLG